MANAKDLFNKLGGSGGGFLKPAGKLAVVPTNIDSDKPAEKKEGKHFDASQKGHNLKKTAGGNTGSVPTGVRPKV